LEIADQTCLVDALTAMGYGGKVEVHPAPVTLIGYDGKPRMLDNHEVRAEIVIRREHLWSAANDIGFARQPDGKYVAYISEYDRHVQPKWHERVMQEYGVAKSTTALRKEGWTVTVTREKGVAKVHGIRYR